jgi:hypothetical protein
MLLTHILHANPGWASVDAHDIVVYLALFVYMCVCCLLNVLPKWFPEEASLSGLTAFSREV